MFILLPTKCFRSCLTIFFFLCSSNFGIIYQRIYIRATKHEWLLTNWSKHVFTIQIWIYSVLICLRRMRRRRRRINKDCIYVMEGWVYIEREKEICLDSRPTCTMILQSLKKIIKVTRIFSFAKDVFSVTTFGGKKQAKEIYLAWRQIKYIYSIICWGGGSSKVEHIS